MKTYLGILFFLLSATGIAQSAYQFITPEGSWQEAGNWLPERTVPREDDQLVFAMNARVHSLPRNITVGSLHILAGVQIEWRSEDTCTILLSQPKESGFAFFLGSNAGLILTDTLPIRIQVAAGSESSLSGIFQVQEASHRLTAATSGAIKITMGGRVITAKGFSGNLFGTQTYNSVVFESGSRYDQQDGGNPFGATAPNSVTTFLPGSEYHHWLTTSPSLSGRTFGHLYLHSHSSYNVTFSRDCRIMNNWTLVNSNFTFNPSSGGSGNLIIKGDINLEGTANLTLGTLNTKSKVILVGENQKIGASTGTGFLKIRNLDLQQGSHATLCRNVYLGGELHLTQGILQSFPDSLLIMEAGSRILSDTNVYDYANMGHPGGYIDGPFQWTITDSGWTGIASGDAGIYAPIRVYKSKADTSIFKFEYFATSSPDRQSLSSALDHVSDIEYWEIKAIGTADSVRVAFSWRPGSAVGTTEEELSQLRIAHYHDEGNGVQWNAIKSMAHPSAIENGHGFLFSTESILSFSPFTLASASILNVLPITKDSSLFKKKEKFTRYLYYDPGSHELTVRNIRNNETAILVWTDMSGKVKQKWSVKGGEPYRKYINPGADTWGIFQLWIQGERRAVAMFWLK